MTSIPSSQTNNSSYLFKNGVRNHWAPIFLMVVVLILLFWDVFQAGMYLSMDVLSNMRISKAYGFGELGKGHILHWDPHQFTGVPFLSGFQEGAFFYPLNAVFLLFEIHMALILILFIHAFLAWVFMYFFIFDVTGNRFSACISAFCFMLATCFLMSFYSGNLTLTSAYPWMAFSLFCFYKATSCHSWRWAVGAGAGLAMQLLAGSPPMAYYTGLALTFYSLGQAWTAKQLTGLCKNMGLLALACLSALLFSAMQIIPSYIFLPYSARAGGVEFDYAMSFSLPPENLFLLIVPFLYGDAIELPYWARWNLWEVMPYFGIFGLFCFVFALWTKNATIRIFTAIAVVAVFMAFGNYTPLGRLYYEFLPGADLFRVPGRYLMIMILSVSVICGLFLNELQKNREMAQKICCRAWKLSIFLILFLILLLPLHTTPIFQNIGFKNVSTNIWLAVCLTMATGILFFYGGKKGINNTFLSLCLLLLITDLCLAGRRYLQPYSPQYPGFSEDIVEILKPENGVPVRISTVTKKDESFLEAADLLKGSLDGIAHVGGISAATLERYMEYANFLNDRPLNAKDSKISPMGPGAMFALMGASYVISKENSTPFPEATLIHSTGDKKIFAIDNPMPRAFLVHQVQIVPDKLECLRLLKDPSFDPLKKVLLEESPAIQPIPLPNHAKESVTFKSYEFEEVVLEVEVSTPAILVLTDAYYPQWKVFVNGVETPMLAADHLFRGVAVNAGKYTVTFQYSKNPFYAGVAITLISLFCTGLFLFPFRYLKKTASEFPSACRLSDN